MSSQTSKYHPMAEKLVNTFCSKTHNEEKLFFRVVVAYYYCYVAAQMRAKVTGWDNQALPINMYALNLSPSGTGKGYSTGIMEDQILAGFRDNFVQATFPLSAESNISIIAAKRAKKRGTDIQEEEDHLKKEFNTAGPLLTSFDGGTPAAVKQMRHKLLVANAAALNLQIDEIGLNLLGQKDILDMYLELYDTGKIRENGTILIAACGRRR